MKVLIATPEAVPYAKTGGLADMAGVLLKELRRQGVEASLVLPLYGSIGSVFGLWRTGVSFALDMGGRAVGASVHTSDKSSCPEAYFIECGSLFGRPELYGSAEGDYPDNALRFAFFSRAVLEMCCAMDIRPDVIHCNEWQTAMLPLYLRKFYADRCFLNAAAVLFTIHNLGYQGIFPPSDLSFTGLGQEYFTPENLEFYGKLNFMKAGLVFADLINTVSSTYAREILEHENGFGLDGVLRQRRDDLYGVVNGVDYGCWDPATDPLIPARYDAGDLSGKRQCKKALLAEAGLVDGRRPLLGVVSRLSSQKGLDLLAEAIDGLIELQVNVALVGKGDMQYQRLLQDASESHRGRVFVKVGFEERLAHLVYAASDFFLMPSRYEPCGLGQLIAMRYGAIPIARKTGGLADTVADYDPSSRKGTGFLFSDYSSTALLDAVHRALEVFRDKKKMRGLFTNVMNADFSLARSAEQYLDLYERVIRKRNPSHPLVTSDSARSIPFSVIDSIIVNRPGTPAVIEFCVGDVTEMDASDGVDVLVVSAFPGDYTPLPGTLIGALDRRGISVQDLSCNLSPEGDLRNIFSCWLSQPLSHIRTEPPFKRILCFEPLRRGKPTERVGDIFRAISPFVLDNTRVRRLAMPIVATGHQGESPTEMLTLLVGAAQEFLVNGLPLTLLRIVAHPPSGLSEQARQEYIVSIKETIVNMKKNAPVPLERQRKLPHEFRYDLFVSYAHEDSAEVDYALEALRTIFPKIRIFLDRTELDTGHSWQHEIFSSLDECWKVMPVYSPSYLKSKVCIEEFNIARFRTREEERSIVYPLYLYSAQLPSYMKLINYEDCREFDRDKIHTTCRAFVSEMKRDGI